MTMNATDVLASIATTTKSNGHKVRNVNYTVSLPDMGDATKLASLAPQAKAVYAILVQTATTKHPLPEGEEGPMPALTLTEPEVIAAVNEHASLLNTRQDPFRIFQYYRAALIDANVLRQTK
jgi:pyruvate/2-oxoglutarate dehydrogenase complex dihydrolipoamide dehydrogenase (E3) component